MKNLYDVERTVCMYMYTKYENLNLVSKELGDNELKIQKTYGNT